MLNKLKNRLIGFLKQNSKPLPQKNGFIMSSNMFRALAQEYKRKLQDPPLMPATIETMTWAYAQICKGEDPWTALGNFTNAWYGYAKHIRANLVCEPLVRPEQETEYTHRWAAFCAASVEFLCERYKVPCPDWVNDRYYFLETPWWRTHWVDDSSIRERLLQEAPIPFARRNIFCSNRLFQNKYEMCEWICEAIDKGMTDPGQIHSYARQKEISVHGA
jgi:hypothetical protein